MFCAKVGSGRGKAKDRRDITSERSCRSRKKNKNLLWLERGADVGEHPVEVVALRHQEGEGLEDGIAQLHGGAAVRGGPGDGEAGPALLAGDPRLGRGDKMLLAVKSLQW